MIKKGSREISDSFWQKVEPLVPPPERVEGKEYKRRPGGGRKPISSRQIFEAIIYKLRTGCQWKELPKERFGSPSAIHAYFLHWLREGFFVAFWRAGLAEHEEMEGIAWRWQGKDESLLETPLVQEVDSADKTHKNGKKQQKASASGKPWCPVVPRRNQRKSKRSGIKK